MEREFVIDDIVRKAKSNTVKLVCKSIDEDAPEMNISITFDGEIPTTYKKIMGSRRYDTFRIEMSGLRHQKTLVD